MGVLGECLNRIDVLKKKQTHEGTVHGGISTVVLIVLCLAVAVVVALYSVIFPPMLTETTVKWSSGGVFPMVLKCVAPTGCYVSEKYSSKGCKHLKNKCTSLKKDETHRAQVCGSASPVDGLMMFHKDHVDQNNVSFGVFSLSDMIMPDGKVMPMDDFLYAGQSTVSYVQTVNHSLTAKLPSQQLRHEWFAVLVGEKATHANMHACKGKVSDIDSYDKARVIIHPYFVFVDVTQPRDLLKALGEFGGITNLIFVFFFVITATISHYLGVHNRNPLLELETRFNKSLRNLHNGEKSGEWTHSPLAKPL